MRSLHENEFIPYKMGAVFRLESGGEIYIGKIVVARVSTQGEDVSNFAIEFEWLMRIQLVTDRGWLPVPGSLTLGKKLHFSKPMFHSSETEILKCVSDDEVLTFSLDQKSKDFASKMKDVYQ